MTHMTFIPFLHQSTRISPPSPSIHHCQVDTCSSHSHSSHSSQSSSQRPCRVNAFPGNRSNSSSYSGNSAKRKRRKRRRLRQAAHAAHAQREAQVAREQREAVREVEQRLGCGEVWQLMCSHSIRVWKMFMMFVFVGFQGGVYNMNYSKYNYRK